MSMNKEPNKIKLIKSVDGCDIDENNLVKAFNSELTETHEIGKRVKRYISHSKNFNGLNTKYASNFHIGGMVNELLKIPGAAFLRFYLASDFDDNGHVTGTFTLLAATDKYGKVLTSIVCEECCGYPPGNTRFDGDPYLT